MTNIKYVTYTSSNWNSPITGSALCHTLLESSTKDGLSSDSKGQEDKSTCTICNSHVQRQENRVHLIHQVCFLNNSTSNRLTTNVCNFLPIHSSHLNHVCLRYYKITKEQILGSYWPNKPPVPSSPCCNSFLRCSSNGSGLFISLRVRLKIHQKQTNLT